MDASGNPVPRTDIHFDISVGAQPNWFNGPTLAGMMAAPIPALFGPDRLDGW